MDKKITNIKERVLYLTDLKGVAKEKFFNEIGMTYGSFKGKQKETALNSDAIDKILSIYNDIDANWLITGEGAIFKKNETEKYEHTRETVVKYESLSKKNNLPYVVTIDSHNNDNIVLVPQKLQAGYLQGYNNPKFIKDLPTYRMPGLNNGIFRMFEIEGNSMFPTLPNKSYVVGQYVEDWVKDIKDNQIYAIISNEVEDGIVKRCINRIEKYNNLICKSDNRRNFPTQNIEPSTIKEVWEIKLHLNFQLPDPADVYDRMNDLEADVQELKRHLAK